MKFFAPIYIIASFNRSAGFEGLPQKERCHPIKKNCFSANWSVYY